MTDATTSEVARGTSTPEVATERRGRAVAKTEALRGQFAHELDVAYGPSERNRYDIYLPNVAPSGPTLVFLHGGGFRVGNWSTDGYNGLPYLEQGAIFVSLGYRLIDEARFPLCAEDVETALIQLRDDVARRGADPERIYLSGHSAGAMLAAEVGLQPGDGFPSDLVKGLVLISGMYDFTRHSDEVVDRSSTRYVDDLCISIANVPGHVITIAGDNDFPDAMTDAVRMAEALAPLGGVVERFVEPDADHFEANRSFSTPGSDVALATAAMMSIQPGG